MCCTRESHEVGVSSINSKFDLITRDVFGPERPTLSPFEVRFGDGVGATWKNKSLRPPT